MGRNYDAVIRVNSQSGKGGVAYLLEEEHGLSLPRRLQIEFSRAIKRVTDETGKEVNAQMVYDIFEDEYLKQNTPWQLIDHQITSHNEAAENERFSVVVRMNYNGEETTFSGKGNGAISAFINALGMPIEFMDYSEHAIGSGESSKAASYIELRLGDSQSGYGVGMHKDIVTSSFLAVISAINRHLQTVDVEAEEEAETV